MLSGLLMMLSLSAQANMVLNKGILNFYAGASIREDVEIFNSGTDPLYLSATVFEIKNPEAAKPERIALTDPRTAELLASPNKLLVLPGQKKILRVIVRSQSSSQQDKVYRIKIIPHVAPIEANVATVATQAGVKVLIGYELLAFVRPINHQAELAVIQEGNILRLQNNGNTNVMIRNIKQCQQKCIELKGKRLYAGQQWQTKLPHTSGKLIIYKSIGTEFSSEEH